MYWRVVGASGVAACWICLSRGNTAAGSGRRRATGAGSISAFQRSFGEQADTGEGTVGPGFNMRLRSFNRRFGHVSTDAQVSETTWLAIVCEMLKVMPCFSHRNCV